MLKFNNFQFIANQLIRHYDTKRPIDIIYFKEYSFTQKQKKNLETVTQG